MAGLSPRPATPGSLFASNLAQPGVAEPAVIDPTAPPTASAHPAIPRTWSWWALGWIGALLVLGLFALVAYFLHALGPVASAVGFVVALVPLAGVFAAISIVDRWEPEPLGLRVVAVAWGAVAAVVIALAVDLAVSVVLGIGDGTVAEAAFSSVIQAPLVEEVAKGLGVYLIFISARRTFDGPVDGIVYGALVGVGFAFTENIQYFALSAISGGAEELTTTFFLRGILSPFAHVMFTSLTGFALGLAARRGAGAGGAVGPMLLGLAGAIGLHALWNGSALFGDFFGLYLTLQVPLFGVFVLGVFALKREEARLTRARLGEYAAAGWFTPEEVDMLATPPGRRAGMRWAATLRGDRRALMRRFIADSTALAATRQRAISGRDSRAAQHEQALLVRTARVRAELFAP